jgi:hypothetical protein
VSSALLEGLRAGSFAYIGGMVLNSYGLPTAKVGVSGMGCPAGDKCWFMEMLNGVPPIKKLAELHDPFIDWSVNAFKMTSNNAAWYKVVTIPPFFIPGCAASATCVTAGLVIASESEGK